MASSPARSAGLLISVYVDTSDGAPWYARLRAFDDATEEEPSTDELMSDPDQLLLAVRRWLEAVLAGP
jgi:hypothetical protein